MGSRLVWCLACALAFGLDYIYFHFLDRKSNRHIFSIFWCLANQDILRWQTFLSLQLLSPPTQTHKKSGDIHNFFNACQNCTILCWWKGFGFGCESIYLKKIIFKISNKKWRWANPMHFCDSVLISMPIFKKHVTLL